MLNRKMASPELRLRYGQISTGGTGFNNFAATLGIPAGSKAIVGVTAGYESLSCTGCHGYFIAGANAERRLASTRLGTGAGAAQLTVGLNGEFGFGQPTDVASTRLVTLTGGLPVALVVGAPTLKIAPFLTPAIGWGRESRPAAVTVTSGKRRLLGGGVTFQSASSAIGGSVGFQKVFINGGDSVVGVSVIFGDR